MEIPIAFRAKFPLSQRSLRCSLISPSPSMAASLGIRPPQFSEDVAWRPVWLQQHQEESLDERTMEPQIPSEQLIKDLALLRGTISEGKHVELSSGDDICNSCHLFLSGEDNSPISFAPSPRNALHFNLHLSSDHDSLCDRSQLVYATENQFKLNKVQSMQEVETSAESGEKTYLSKMDCNTGGVILSSFTSIPRAAENVAPQSLTSERDDGRQCEEDFNITYLGGADIDDAVELSIAASEALVIHELVKSESILEISPTESVLEVALRVKQARLEGKKKSYCKAKEIYEIDFLSDLDDLIMADAFEDVGISFNGPNDQCVYDSDTSQVNNTLSGLDYGCNDSCNDFDSMAKELNFEYISIQKQLEDVSDGNLQRTKDLPIESPCCEKQNKQFDERDLKSNSTLVSHIDPMLHQETQENTDVSVMLQKVVSPLMDASSPQPQTDINSSPLHWKSEKSGVEKVNYSSPDRFRSRWFGGWAMKVFDIPSRKEINASPELQKNNMKSIWKYFVDESSFLSESADVAPDENSFVLKHETRSKTVSQSSIHFEGLCEKAVEGLLLSQDETSCSLSLVDPLCSVVPCSISSENNSSPVAHNGIDTEFDTKRCGFSTPELGMENLHKTSDLNVGYFHGDGQSMAMIGCEGSVTTGRRQLTSLKSYSTLLPGIDSFNKLKFQSQWHQGLLSADHNVGCTVSSLKQNSNGLLPFGSIPEFIGRDSEESCENAMNENPVLEIVNQNTCHENLQKDQAELLVQALKEWRSPSILKHRVHRIHASKHLVNGSNQESYLHKQAAVPENEIKLLHGKNHQYLQLEPNTHLDTQAPGRKRVRFVEAEIHLKQDKDIQQLQSRCRYSLTTRASKRSKFSSPLSVRRTQDARKFLTTRCVRNGKSLIFQGIEFLITGFSSHKEKEIEGLIRKYGGMVLPDIPSPPNLRRKRSSHSNFQHIPVVLCSKKLQTAKFLFGCAVNAFLLKVNWLTDSIAAGSVVLPEKYMILSHHNDVRGSRIGKSFHHSDHKCIFERVGIILDGKHNFCTKFAKIFKHGGGLVFKTLMWLVQSLETGNIYVGAIVAEHESQSSRHLRQCAAERKLPVMSGSWIIKSLHSGKLIPLMENNRSSPTIEIPKLPSSAELSQEI